MFDELLFPYFAFLLFQYMEQTGCSETLAFELQMPANHTEESIQHPEHGESLKSRNLLMPYLDLDSRPGHRPLSGSSLNYSPFSNAVPVVQSTYIRIANLYV
jgi:hypothetical protein